MKQGLERFYPLIIFVFAFLLYANTIPNDYNFNDELVTNNHRTTSKGFSGIKEIFTSFYYEDEMGYKYEYRPITHLSFSIENQFFGDNPHVSHAVNVFLYSLLCVIVFFLAKRLMPNQGVLAFVVALIFVAHPIHTDAVASIKNRDEILSLGFGLLSFLVVSLTFRHTKLLIKISLLLIGVMFFYLSLYAKLSTVLLVVIIPLYAISQRCLERVHGVYLVLSIGLIAKVILLSWASVFILMSLFSLLFYTLFPLVIRARDLSYKEVLKKPLESRMFFWVLLSSSYLIFILAYFLGSSFLFSFALVFALLSLFLAYLAQRAELLSFLMVYPIIISVAIIFNNNFIEIPFFLLLLIRFRNEPKSRVLIFFLAFLAISFYSILLKNPIVVFSLAIFLSLLWKKSFRFVVFLGIAMSLRASFEFPYLFICTLFFGIYLLIDLNFINNVKFAFFKKYEKIPLFVLLIFASLSYNLYFSDYSELPKQKLNIRAEFSELIEDQSSLKVNEERPILYIENPVVENWDFRHKLALALNTNRFYIGKLLFPYPLSFYYGYNQFKMFSFEDWQTIFSIFILVSILLLLVYFFKTKNYIVFLALLWLELSILPYSNFFIPIAGIVGERLAFTASFPFSLLLGKFAISVKERWRVSKLLSFIFSLILLSSIALVVSRNMKWSNPLVLFKSDIGHLTNSAIAHSMLGEELLNQASVITDPESLERKQMLDSCIYAFNTAIQISNSFHNDFYHLGIAHYLQGNFLEAQAAFVESYKIDSSYLSLPYFNMALWATELRQDSIAIYNYNQYLVLEPYDEMAYFNLFELLMNNRANVQATLLLEKMLISLPDNILVYYNLFELHKSFGNFDQSSYYLQKGLELDSFQMKQYLLE